MWILRRDFGYVLAVLVALGIQVQRDGAALRRSQPVGQQGRRIVAGGFVGAHAARRGPIKVFDNQRRHRLGGRAIVAAWSCLEIERVAQSVSRRRGATTTPLAAYRQ